LNIALVRHPAPSIDAGICYGRLDLALSPEGSSAIPGIADRLSRFPAAKIWSSPARRCRALALALAETTSSPRLEDTRLLELDFGAWEGAAWDHVPRDALDRWAADPLGFAPPGGESGAALIARVRSFHADLVADQQDCAVVSHGGPLKLLAMLLRGRDMDLFAKPPPLGGIDIVAC
jgi:alpha-ribazole phosphatase